MNRTYAFVGVAAIALAVAAWMITWPDPVQVAHANTSEDGMARVDHATDSGPNGVAIEGGSSRQAVKGPGKLKVFILGADSQPSPGKIYWLTSPTAPATSCLMAPEHGYPLPSSGVQQQSHDGEAQLDIPAAHWTWVRVTGERDGFASRYARIAPFSGEQRLEIQLDPNHRGIHAFVVQTDLTTPASEVSVRLLSAAMDAPDQLTLLATRKTDAWGYCYFEDLEPGSFLLLAPGVRRGAKMPYAQRVLLPDTVAMSEIALTLVVPEPRVSIQLDVNATLEKAPQLPPKLYLKRQNDHLGELYPMEGVLSAGAQKLSFQVPVGKYEIGVLPLGRAHIHPDQTTIDVVEDDQVFPVTVMGRMPKKEIRLDGLPRNAYPVTVFPRPSTPLLDDEFALMFCGPFKWQVDTQVTALPNMVCDLVVTSRRGFWLSKGPVSLAGPKIRVDLQPATQVSVTWKHFPHGMDLAALLHVRTSGSEFYRVMSRRFAPDGGRTDPAFVATLIVPRGPVTVECQKKDGSIYWRRTLQAKEFRQSVAVSDR